jgi:hypothetical protein
MHIVDWRRLVLCGLIAGTVSTLLSIAVVSVGGGDLFAAVSERLGGAPVASSSLTLYLLSLAAGVWVMWVYALIRPQLRSDVQAAFIAGLMWWVIASLQSLKWVAVLGLPIRAWAPVTASAVSSVVATAVGAKLYAMVRSQPRAPGGPGGNPERR